mmetsp:Transcript_7553/g.13947  ORF Transcript_7553/g.13947 Transcript_7553/m.13947 type:complete len:571 (+) Transcript_7553:79-1791(+)
MLRCTGSWLDVMTSGMIAQLMSVRVQADRLQTGGGGVAPKGKKECCEAWNGLKDMIKKIPGLALKNMGNAGCPDFDVFGTDPETCEAAEDAQESGAGDSGGPLQSLNWVEVVSDQSWKKAKGSMGKLFDELQELEARVEEQRKTMTSMRSTLVEDVIKNAQREGFVPEDKDAVGLAQRWMKFITPQEFAKLFQMSAGIAKVPPRALAEIMPKPELFQRRAGALKKFFAMMHIEGSVFLKDSMARNGMEYFKWPTLMLDDTTETDFGSVLDSLSDKWEEKCSACPIEKSCLSPSPAQECGYRQAIAFDPSSGPLDKAIWETFFFQWRCIDSPELLSSFAVKKCNTKGTSSASFDQKRAILKQWLLTARIEHKSSVGFDASKNGWFKGLSQEGQEEVLDQIIGRGELDAPEVPGPMTPEHAEQGRGQLATLKSQYGMSYESEMSKWLDTGFGGAYKESIPAAIRQIQGVRPRAFVQWPACPPTSTDCLGSKVRDYLFKKISSTSSTELTKASISWGTTNVEEATVLLSAVKNVSTNEERQQFKEASDKLMKEIKKEQAKGNRIAKLVYDGNA